ncbi:hypothetical protein C4D60_Mb04t00850 [Musa balbisiana]|uniref:Uncharacterized protein n=1 Tax=Musa balbisiana TaxID=52838 RepID=A0A4S8K8R0_MUSBA|nr:hypothetical protein C4D60_Mb04t00850 [Musa balbisiana]
MEELGLAHVLFGGQLILLFTAETGCSLSGSRDKEGDTSSFGIIVERSEHRTGEENVRISSSPMEYERERERDEQLVYMTSDHEITSSNYALRSRKFTGYVYKDTDTSCRMQEIRWHHWDWGAVQATKCHHSLPKLSHGKGLFGNRDKKFKYERIIKKTVNRLMDKSGVFFFLFF